MGVELLRCGARRDTLACSLSVQEYGSEVFLVAVDCRVGALVNAVNGLASGFEYIFACF